MLRLADPERATQRRQEQLPALRIDLEGEHLAGKVLGQVLKRQAQAGGVAKRGAPMVSVSGASLEEAQTKADNLYIARQWGDGLPVVPATASRVDWMLRGTALPRTHIIGKFPPRGGVTTVEQAAIALAMAGGRPEYLPVLLAAVDRLGVRLVQIWITHAHVDHAAATAELLPCKTTRAPLSMAERNAAKASSTWPLLS